MITSKAGRGEIHGISHLPVRGRDASLAPVRLALIDELRMLRAQLGRSGLGGGGGGTAISGRDQGILPDSARMLASPARRVSTAPPPCSMAFLAGVLGSN